MTLKRRALLPALIVLVLALVGVLLLVALRPRAADGPGESDRADDAVSENGTGPRRDADAPPPGRREAGTLLGNVRRRDDGAPARDVRVVLSGQGMERVATTGRDGGFAFEDVDRRGRFDLSVHVAGFGPLVRRGLRLGRHRRMDLGTLWLSAAARVRVVVRDVGGGAVEGASVEAYLAGEGASPFASGSIPAPVSSRLTDASGTAAFDDLSADTWVFVARATGRERRSTGPVNVHGSTALQRFLITMGVGAELTGVVTERGGGTLAGVELVALRRTLAADERTAPLAVRTVSGSDGSYTLRGLPVGDVVIWAARDREPLAVAAAVSVPEVGRLDLTLPAPTRLVGRLVQAESGEPLVDAEVEVRFVLPLGIPTSVGGSVDDAGEFELRLPGAGRVEAIDVVAAGMHPVKGWGPSLGIETSEGQVVEVVVEMAAGVRLSGVVRAEGAGLAGARVVVVHAVETRETTTDYEGRYVFESLREGAVTVRASRWGHASASAQVEIPADRAGGIVRQDFELARGERANGVVLDADGEFVPGAEVFVTDQPRAVGTETDAQGRFETGPLGPGEHWIEVHHDGHSPAYAQVSGGRAVVVRLVPLVRIHGRVTDRAGAAIPGAIVRAAGSAGTTENGDPLLLDWAWLGMERSSVAANGTFDHRVAIVESEFLVRAEAPGFAPLVVPGSTDALHLTLDRGATIDGVVEDREGRAIAGAWVAVTRIADSADPAGVRYPGAWGPPVRAVTGADGRFEITGLERERYLVLARVEGAWVARAAVDPPSGAVTLTVR